MKILNKLIPLNQFLKEKKGTRERVNDEDYLFLTIQNSPEVALVSIPFFEKLMECYEQNGGDGNVNR